VTRRWRRLAMSAPLVAQIHGDSFGTWFWPWSVWCSQWLFVFLTENKCLCSSVMFRKHNLGISLMSQICCVWLARMSMQQDLVCAWGVVRPKFSVNCACMFFSSLSAELSISQKGMMAECSLLRVSFPCESFSFYQSTHACLHEKVCKTCLLWVWFICWKWCEPLQTKFPACHNQWNVPLHLLQPLVPLQHVTSCLLSCLLQCVSWVL